MANMIPADLAEEYRRRTGATLHQERAAVLIELLFTTAQGTDWVDTFLGEHPIALYDANLADEPPTEMEAPHSCQTTAL